MNRVLCRSTFLHDGAKGRDGTSKVAPLMTRRIESGPRFRLPEQVSRRAIELDGKRISWIEVGSGLPLVLLHGIGSWAESWMPIFPLLEDRYRVIAWDMPGYGFSSTLDEVRPSAGIYGQHLVAFLRELEVGSVCLVGHSLGALIAGELARREPDRVRALVLASPALGSACSANVEIPAAIGKRLEDLRRLGSNEFARIRAPNLCGNAVNGAALRAVEHAMAQVRLPGYAHACWMLAQGNLVEAVREIPIRGLVLSGALDQVVPPAKAQHLAAAWKGARYHEVEGIGHAGYVEDPKAYASPIRTFLEEEQA